jgi:SAM-dependent methyltransferase/uncharacterized membrane protein YbhN (UPF0104 family)
MKITKPLLINIVFVLLGVIVAVLWLYISGASAIAARLLESNPAWLLMLLAVTIYFIFMRFFRWQYMLRRVGIRIPIRPNLRIYLASLIGTATPAYLGEMLRGVFIRSNFGIPFRISAWVLTLERLLDVLTLAMFGLLTAIIPANRWLMLLVILGTLLLILFASFVAKQLGVPSTVINDSLMGKTILTSIALTIVVWIPTSLIVYIATMSMGLWLSPIDAIHVFSHSTIIGGLSLSPAGLGVTGSVMIFNLERLNFSLTNSVTIVTIVRLMSTGLYLSVGGIFMAREYYEYRRSKNKRIEFHFDEISTEYQNQFKEHVWNYLLTRKSSYMASMLEQKSLMHGLGLDLGCGLGLQSKEMKRRGYNVFGMDMAYNLLSHAKDSGFDVVNGDALRLPFKDESLDYVYTIGVLHHLSGLDFQKKVCAEVHRILKPGGIFIVHETNPRNPLFRFYMGYVFPILRSIDEGTEWWIEPNFWEQTRGLDLVNVTYFTFMPDFIPEFLMKQFHRIERFLEQSAFREYSVHYMAVVEKI